MMSGQDALIESWQREEQEPFVGWDFSYLDGRWLEETAPWSYTQMVRDVLPQVDSLLDLGTGGGERLLKLQDLWPKRTVATEEW
jgi:hypothetical protein